MLKLSRNLIAATIVLSYLCAFNPIMHGEEGVWQTDFAAAKAKAKAENKLLLVDFTGSDWCGWCMKLKKEVFSTEQFQAEASKHFVLVEIDTPHKTKLSEELTKQNDELLKKYKIVDWPVILVLDPEGEVIAHTGYLAGGPEPYTKRLNNFLDLYASIVKAKPELDTAKGLDRAKLLDLLIHGYVELNAEHKDFADWSKEIVSLDPDNKTGLRLKHQFRLQIIEGTKLRSEHKFDEAKAAVDQALAMEGIQAELKQDGYMAEANICFSQQNYAGIVTWLEKSLALDPNSPEGVTAKTTIDKFKPMAEAQEAIAKIKTELDKSEGLDRAKLLDGMVEALQKMGPVGHDPARAKEIANCKREIISLDPDNKSGLMTKYEYPELISEIASCLKSKDWDKAKSAVDKAQALQGLSDDQKKKIKSLSRQIEVLKSRA